MRNQVVIITKKVSVGATFANDTATYTGAKMTYEAATGFNASLFNVVYTYSADMINAGKYTVTATFTLKDPANYELEGDDAVSATFTITPIKISLDEVLKYASFDDCYVAYDGANKKDSLVVVLPLDMYTYVTVEYVYTQNGEVVTEMSEKGTYTVTAHFTSTDPNYVINGVNSASATLTIY